MVIFGVISSSALQPANGNRFAINFIATADRLTRTSAGASEHARYNICLAVQKICFVKTGLRDKTNISRNIGMGWTAYLTGNIRLIPVRIRHNRLVSRSQFAIGINHFKNSPFLSIQPTVPARSLASAWSRGDNIGLHTTPCYSRIPPSQEAPSRGISLSCKYSPSLTHAYLFILNYTTTV